MRKLFIVGLLASVASISAPVTAQKFGNKGGIGSNDSVYSNGEPVSGTYSINGDTGAAKLGSLIVNGPVTATNISGVNTGDQIDITGNAATATRLTTPRTINGILFDGTTNITINAVDSTARLSASSNLSDLTNITTARSNLGAAARGVNLDITSIVGSSAKWTIPRTLSTTGDINWSMSVDGSANVSGTSTISANAVTNAKSAQMPPFTVKGNVTNVTDTATDLSKSQLTSLINPFTSTLSGAVPASGGGTTNYLRADGAWVPVTSGSNGSLTNFSFTNGAGISGVVINSTSTPTLSLSLDDITPTSVTATTTDGTSSFSTGANLYQNRFGNNNNMATINIGKSRGTNLSPTSVTNGDFLGAYNVLGYDGNGYLNTFRIRTQVNGTVASGSIPTDTTFSVNNNTMLTLAGSTNTVGLLVPVTGTTATFTGGIAANSSVVTGTSTAALHTGPVIVATDASGVVADGGLDTTSNSYLQVIGKSGNDTGMQIMKYGTDAKGAVNYFVKTRDATPNTYVTPLEAGDRVKVDSYQGSTGSGYTGHVLYEGVYVDGPRQPNTIGELPGSWYVATGTGYGAALNPNYYGVATAITANSKQQVFFPGAQYVRQTIANTSRMASGVGVDYGAIVVIGPGGATPSAAPLKFDYAHSTLLTTPEPGAIEVDINNQMYATDANSVRRTLAYTDSTNWPIVNSTSGSTGSIGSGMTGAVVPTLTTTNKGLVTSIGSYTLGSAANYSIGTSGATVPLLNTANTFSGKISLQSSSSGSAGINIPKGTTPSPLTDGDLWRSNSGNIRVYNNGLTNTLAYLEVNNTWSGTQTMNNSTTSASGFNITPGVSPASPVAGDVWTTATAIQAQVRGITQIVQTADQSAPSVTIGSAAGSGSTVSVDSYGSSGKVTLIIPSGSSSTPGTIFTLTYAHAYTSTSYPVITASPETNGPRIGVSGTSTGFTLYLGSALGEGTYVFNYYAPGK